MGDPKHPKKKYETPLHPWQRSRMEEETKILKEFGLKNKTEIWKLRTKWREWARLAKKLASLHTKQSEVEKKQLLEKLHKFGLVEENATVNDVLAIELRDLFMRRLQSVVVKCKLARSMKQARQFIVHKHILVNGKTMTTPSYLVSIVEENKVTFGVTSALFSLDHPERVKDDGNTTKN